MTNYAEGIHVRFTHSEMDFREEYVPPADGAVWQSEEAKTYRCPYCQSLIRAHFEGSAAPAIMCREIGTTGRMEHILRWEGVR